MTNAYKTCTVSFFELVRGPNQQRFAGLNWQSELALVEARASTSGPIIFTHNLSEVDASAFKYGSRRALRLGTDRLLTPRQRNTTTNERDVLRTRGDDWEPTEETFAAFFDYNIFGILRSSMSSPSHSAVAASLNTALRPQDKFFARPLIDRDRYEKLREMDGASIVTFAARPRDVRQANSSFLRGMISLGGSLNEEARIEIKLTVPRGSAGSHDRETLLGGALEVLGDITEGGVTLEKAKVMARSADGAPPEELDLLHHRLTRKVDVPVQDATGSRSLSEDSAFIALHDSERELHDELLAAVGANQS